MENLIGKCVILNGEWFKVTRLEGKYCRVKNEQNPIETYSIETEKIKKLL